MHTPAFPITRIGKGSTDPTWKTEQQKQPVQGNLAVQSLTGSVHPVLQILHSHKPIAPTRDEYLCNTSSQLHFLSEEYGLIF